MKKWIILLMLAVLLGCSAERTEEPKLVLTSLKVGEKVYVCGCPMMCCHSISRGPGRCACNVPLRRGDITSIQDGKIHVRVAGREKVIFLAHR